MYKTENALITTDNNDYKCRKTLYEKMGDGAVQLKNFKKALEYYEKMLEVALANGDTGKELSICYVSIAQTYKDDKQYDKAIEYFEKDLKVCDANDKEAALTLYYITGELHGLDFFNGK